MTFRATVNYLTVQLGLLETVVFTVLKHTLLYSVFSPGLDATNSSPWSSVNTSGVAPVPHGTIPDWTLEPDQSAEQVEWAHFGSPVQQSVTETRYCCDIKFNVHHLK